MIAIPSIPFNNILFSAIIAADCGLVLFGKFFIAVLNTCRIKKTHTCCTRSNILMSMKQN